MKGIFLGGSTGVSRKFDELREIDSGKLALTNKRVIFDGNFNARTIDLEKSFQLKYMTMGLRLHVKTRNRVSCMEG